MIDAQDYELHGLRSSDPDRAVGHDGADQMTLYPANGQANQLIMQGDGNLVLCTPSSSSLWAIGIGCVAGAYRFLRNDGNLVVYQGSTPIWASYTFC